MKTILLIKKLLSYLTDKPIYIGEGLTIDDVNLVDTRPKNPVYNGRKVHRVTVKYVLQPDFHTFELVGVKLDPVTGVIQYTVSQCATGREMVLEKSLFNTMFERVSE